MFRQNLLEHAERRERAEHAIQRIFVRPGSCREIDDRSWTVCEPIGDAKLYGDIQGARGDVAGRKLEHEFGCPPLLAERH